MFKEVIFIFIISIICVNAGEYLDINISYDNGVYDYEIIGLNYYDVIDNEGNYVYQVFDLSNNIVEMDSFEFDREIRFYYENGTDETFLRDYYSGILSVKYDKNILDIFVYNDSLDMILEINLVDYFKEEEKIIEEPVSEEKKYLLYILIFSLIIILILILRNLRKKVFIFFILFSFLISAAGLNFGESLGYETNDYLSFSGDPNGVSSSSLNDLNVINIEKEGDLKIGDNEFKNIIPTENGKSTFTLDAKGDLVEADFKIGDQGGDYNIKGTKFYAPPGSNVKFKDGIITLNAPKDSEFKELPMSENGPDMKITGENVKINQFNTLNKGEILIKGNTFYTKDSVINGIHVYSEQETKLFFDGNKHGVDTSYISLGEVGVYTNIAKDKGDFNLDFTKDSFFKGDVKFDFDDKESYSLKMEDYDPNPVVRLYSKLGGKTKLFRMQNGPNIFDTYTNRDIRFVNDKSNIKAVPFEFDIGIGFVNFEEDGSFNLVEDLISKPKFFVDKSSKRLLEKKYNIKLNGDYSKDQLSYLGDVLDSSTPEMRVGLKEIVLYNNKNDLLKACHQSDESTVGCIGNNVVEVTSDKFSDDEFLVHELSHPLIEKYSSRYKKGEKNLFKQEWYDIHKGNDAYPNKKLSDGLGWSDESLFEVAYGYATPYGATDWDEDISDMTTKIRNRPMEFKQHICEYSPYTGVYIASFDFLVKYKFITEEDKQKVFEQC